MVILFIAFALELSCILVKNILINTLKKRPEELNLKSLRQMKVTCKNI